MVMVLLFLGVVFLLVGFQAMGVGRRLAVPTIRRWPRSAPPRRRRRHRRQPAPPRPMFASTTSRRSPERAESTADQLREAGWNVTETGNLDRSPDVTATTVYFGDAPGEQAVRRRGGPAARRRRSSRGLPNWPSNHRASSWWSRDRLTACSATVADLPPPSVFAAPVAAERLQRTRDAELARRAPRRRSGPGSPSPSASPARRAQGAGARRAGDKLTAQLKTADGTTVATADFEFASGYATVTVEDHRHRQADAGLPRPAHPLGRQVRSQLGRPDRRRAGRLPLRRRAFPGRPATAGIPPAAT